MPKFQLPYVMIKSFWGSSVINIYVIIYDRGSWTSPLYNSHLRWLCQTYPLALYSYGIQFESGVIVVYQHSYTKPRFILYNCSYRFNSQESVAYKHVVIIISHVPHDKYVLHWSECIFLEWVIVMKKHISFFYQETLTQLSLVIFYPSVYYPFDATPSFLCIPLGRSNY